MCPPVRPCVWYTDWLPTCWASSATDTIGWVGRNWIRARNWSTLNLVAVNWRSKQNRYTLTLRIGRYSTHINEGEMHTVYYTCLGSRVIVRFTVGLRHKILPNFDLNPAPTLSSTRIKRVRHRLQITIGEILVGYFVLCQASEVYHLCPTTTFTSSIHPCRAWVCSKNMYSCG